MRSLLKFFLIALFCLVATTAAQAQIDRSKPPVPGPAPEIKIGDAQTFNLDNGLKVYVVENRKLPTLSISLSLFRDPLLEKEKAGMLSMYGQIMQAGTQNMTKEELDEAVDFIGANLSASATGMYGYSLSRHQDRLLELMTDVLYNPLFPESELEKAKKQTISGLATEKEDPNAISRKITDALLYGADHPYGEPVTEQTVSNVSIEDIKSYYDTFYRPNIASLVLVGNISLDEAKSLANKYFSSWEAAEVPSFSYDDPAPTPKTGVALMNRESSVQSVINITHTIPLKTGDEDVIKTGLVNQILGGGSSSRLFRNLREDKGYTYGAYSSISSQRLVGSFSAGASVRNAVTDSAVNEFMQELMLIRDELVEEEELNNAKASIIGSFSRSLESPQTVANFALNIDRYNLPADYYKTYLQKLNAVTREDIKATAQKYIHPDKANIVVVGNAKEIAKGLEAFGEIKYFDADGNPTEAPKEAESSNLTANQIFDKFIDAVGGAEKIKALQDVKMVGSATIQEQPAEMAMIYGQPGQFSMQMSMSGMTLSEQTVNGSEVVAKQMGQSMPLDEKTKASLSRDAYLVPELYFEENGVESEVLGIEDVQGTRAYAVKITDAAGSYTNYYDADSFLRIRRVSTQEGPQGAMNITATYLKWEPIEGGVLMPTVLGQDLGMMKLEFTFDQVEVGQGAAAMFE